MSKNSARAVHPTAPMTDVQSAYDDRRVPIRKVGVKDIRYPIKALDRQERTQSTVARVSLFVDLPHHFKGTHMSRFVEILNEHGREITHGSIATILAAMVDRLNSEMAHIEVRFPYFIMKHAPVSGAPSLMDYDCAFLADFRRGSARPDTIMEVKVPATSLCPCSKEISEVGAHNQRSIITIRVRYRAFIWIEELIEIAEAVASSDVYALLKREDEKYVTERAYRHPAFVEDLVRSVAVRLRNDPRISWYQVESENFESIHNHSAYAMVVSAEA
jgi:GTP cyclohydrolase I